MTQTNDPPLISSIDLIPDAAEKADLDAPNDSGGKLVIGQAPNITITETTVVADADERLALDVQEGDIAIQTNVNSSFIFTGGDNVANNWQTIDFDAVGAIDSEDINPRDISPRNITATGDISLQDLTVAGAFNGADTSEASAGEALTSDGSGSFSFTSVGGDLVSLTNDFANDITNIVSSTTDMQIVANSGILMQEVTALQTLMDEVIASGTAMQEVRDSPLADSAFHLSAFYAEALDDFAGINTGITGGIDDIAASQNAMQEVAASQNAMQEVAASQTAMQEIAASQTAFQEIASSATARSEIEASNTAITALNNNAVSGSQSYSTNRAGNRIETIADTNNSPTFTWIKEITVSSSSFSSQFNADLAIQDDGTTIVQQLSGSITAGGFFAQKLEFGQVSNGNSSGQSHEVTANYEYLDV